MDDNIFLQKKKYNPDVNKKFQQKKNSRNVSYKKNNQYMNPITNLKTNNVKSFKDLSLPNNVNFDVRKKNRNIEAERSKQNYEFQQNLKKQKSYQYNNLNRSCFSSSHQQMKKSVPKNNNKNNNILNDLKSLGIIK